MDRFDRKIEKKDYDNMVAMNYGEQSRYCEEHLLSDAILYGYGFYGHSAPFEKNGEYFISIECGSSCD